MIYRAFKDYTHSCDAPIQLMSGDTVNCIEDSNPAGDWPNWVLCKNSDDEGWVPKQIIDRRDGQGIITEDYSAAEHDLTPGELFYGTRHLNGWIWCAKNEESVPDAWAPLNCLHPEFTVTEIDSVVPLQPLADEASAEGFGFVQKLIDQILSGENDFSGDGEVLLCCLSGGECLAVCGLNTDPYTDEPGTGRLRRLYVAERVRREGLGRNLAESVIERARSSFRRLRLYSADDGAAAFYQSIGFSRSNKNRESHIMEL